MEIDLRFAGEGSKATVSGVFVGRNSENFNLLTHQDHHVGHCKSDLLYIGTLAGTSKSNYLGKITIAPKAQRSDAYQKNRNLVLNKGVSVNSSPKLEIGANDVRCTHGSTTARISDLEMFYLRSRGIDKGTVKMLLADGFISQVLRRASKRRFFKADLHVVSKRFFTTGAVRTPGTKYASGHGSPCPVRTKKDSCRSTIEKIKTDFPIFRKRSPQ